MFTILDNLETQLHLDIIQRELDQKGQIPMESSIEDKAKAASEAWRKAANRTPGDRLEVLNAFVAEIEMDLEFFNDEIRKLERGNED
jgi:hypothetical protein